VRRRRFFQGLLDVWLPPEFELALGCVVLIVSWEWFWMTGGAVWGGWHNRIGTLAVVLGPWFITRAWKRRPPPPYGFPEWLRERLAAELEPNQQGSARWLQEKFSELGVELYPLWEEDEERELHGTSAYVTYGADEMCGIAAYATYRDGGLYMTRELLRAEDEQAVCAALERLRKQVTPIPRRPDWG
jgi:hypothetical protein